MEVLLLLLFMLAFMALGWTGPNPLARAARWGRVVGQALAALRLRRAPAADPWLIEMQQAHQLTQDGQLEAAARALDLALGAVGTGPDRTTRTARALGQLVGVEIRLGRLAEARGHIEQMDALIAAGEVPLISHFGSDLHEFLAILHRLDDRPAAAETHLRAAIRIEEKLGGPRTPTLRTALGELAELYRGRHHYAAAAAMLERMLALEYPTSEEIARARRETRLELGGLELARDNRAAAQVQFAHVVQELDQPGLPDPPEWRRLSSAWHGLAEVQLRAGRHADAEELLECALRLRRTHASDNRISLLPLLDTRARIYTRSGRIEAAEDVRQEILTITQGMFGLESMRLAGPLEELADLKVRRQRPDEAMPLIEKAARLLWQEGGPDQPALSGVMEKQAALLQTAGYRLQAEGARATARSIGKRLAQRWDRN